MEGTGIIHNQIAGGLHLASVSPAHSRATLAILHGYGDHAGRYEHVLHWMADHDIACRAVDFRGHGRSPGRVGYVRRWDEHLEDVAAFLSVLPTDQPLFVLGHSHGGLVAVAAAVAGKLNRCRGVILSAPYLGLKMPVPIHKRVIAAVASRIAPALRIKSGIAGEMLTSDPAMIAAGRVDPFCRGIATPRWYTTCRDARAAVLSSAEEFKLPLLTLVPGDDLIADAAVTADFFRRVGSTDKTIVHYPGYRHELLRETGREAVMNDVLEWVRARL